MHSYDQTIAERGILADAFVESLPVVRPPWESEAAPQHSPATVLIDPRALTRECLLRALREMRLDQRVEATESVDEWLETAPTPSEVSIVLLASAGRSPAELKRDWSRIVVALGRKVPVVLLADEEQADYVLEAIDDGVRGYIPLCVPLGVALEAIELVRAGGTFVPASAFMRRTPVRKDSGETLPQFTGRQAEVAQALRKGTSNKVIAHELGMAESTVKVHVRNIMRKLKARNRTHVAFLLNEREKTQW